MMKHHLIDFPGKAFKGRADKHASFIDLVNISADNVRPKSLNQAMTAPDRLVLINRY